MHPAPWLSARPRHIHSQALPATNSRHLDAPGGRHPRRAPGHAPGHASGHAPRKGARLGGSAKTERRRSLLPHIPARPDPCPALVPAPSPCKELPLRELPLRFAQPAPDNPRIGQSAQVACPQPPALRSVDPDAVRLPSAHVHHTFQRALWGAGGACGLERSWAFHLHRRRGWPQEARNLPSDAASAPPVPLVLPGHAPASGNAGPRSRRRCHPALPSLPVAAKKILTARPRPRMVHPACRRNRQCLGGEPISPGPPAQLHSRKAKSQSHRTHTVASISLDQQPRRPGLASRTDLRGMPPAGAPSSSTSTGTDTSIPMDQSGRALSRMATRSLAADASLHESSSTATARHLQEADRTGDICLHQRQDHCVRFETCAYVAENAIFRSDSPYQNAQAHY
jgi:hypothetical protein